MGEKAIVGDKRKALEAVARAVSVEEFYPLMDFVMGSAGAVYRRERNQSREERKAAGRLADLLEGERASFSIEFGQWKEILTKWLNVLDKERSTKANMGEMYFGTFCPKEPGLGRLSNKQFCGPRPSKNFGVWHTRIACRLCAP